VLDEINLDNGGRLYNLEREVQESIDYVKAFNIYEDHLKVFKSFDEGERLSHIYPNGTWTKVVRVE
jgi:hypothetical protein